MNGKMLYVYVEKTGFDFFNVSFETIANRKEDAKEIYVRVYARDELIYISVRRIHCI